jgi:hypothetical protein
MTQDKTCDVCGRAIGRRDVSFVLRLELFADPEPPVITKEDLERDHRAEMEALLAAMANIDPGEAMDEVHERYDYIICSGCRGDIHHRLKFPFLTRE